MKCADLAINEKKSLSGIRSRISSPDVDDALAILVDVLVRIALVVGHAHAVGVDRGGGRAAQVVPRGRDHFVVGVGRPHEIIIECRVSLRIEPFHGKDSLDFGSWQLNTRRFGGGHKKVSFKNQNTLACIENRDTMRIKNENSIATAIGGRHVPRRGRSASSAGLFSSSRSPLESACLGNDTGTVAHA